MIKNEFVKLLGDNPNYNADDFMSKTTVLRYFTFM